MIAVFSPALSKRKSTTKVKVSKIFKTSGQKLLVEKIKVT